MRTNVDGPSRQEWKEAGKTLAREKGAFHTRIRYHPYVICVIHLTLLT